MFLDIQVLFTSVVANWVHFFVGLVSFWFPFDIGKLDSLSLWWWWLPCSCFNHFAFKPYFTDILQISLPVGIPVVFRGFLFSNWCPLCVVVNCPGIYAGSCSLFFNHCFFPLFFVCSVLFTDSYFSTTYWLLAVGFGQYWVALDSGHY